ILCFLSTSDLYRFGASCKYIQMIVQDFAISTFNVNRRLKKFFEDPESFRKMQAETGTLVSGSFVLQILLREYWPSSDLDLYIWPNEYDNVKEWLKSAGYAEKGRESNLQNPEETEVNASDHGEMEEDNGDEPTSEVTSEEDELSVASLSSSYPLSSLVAVTFFEKKVKGKETLRVQIMVPEATPIQSILRFHSS
ncbi:hypothetical protein M422DRAFT_106270, partial [Sphaerobolus stellatus SS14]